MQYEVNNIASDEKSLITGNPNAKISNEGIDRIINRFNTKIMLTKIE